MVGELAKTSSATPAVVRPNLPVLFHWLSLRYCRPEAASSLPSSDLLGPAPAALNPNSNDQAEPAAKLPTFRLTGAEPATAVKRVTVGEPLFT